MSFAVEDPTSHCPHVIAPAALSRNLTRRVGVAIDFLHSVSEGISWRRAQRIKDEKNTHSHIFILLTEFVYKLELQNNKREFAYSTRVWLSKRHLLLLDGSKSCRIMAGSPDGPGGKIVVAPRHEVVTLVKCKNYRWFELNPIDGTLTWFDSRGGQPKNSVDISGASAHVGRTPLAFEVPGALTSLLFHCRCCLSGSPALRWPTLSLGCLSPNNWRYSFVAGR